MSKSFCKNGIRKRTFFAWDSVDIEFRNDLAGVLIGHGTGRTHPTHLRRIRRRRTRWCSDRHC